MNRVSDIRKRKIAHYKHLLGETAESGPVPADLGDLGYAAELGRIAAAAPADFALRAGASRRLSDLGLLGHLVMSCATLGDTYEVWMRHSAMAGEPVTLQSKIDDGGRWVLEFTPLPFLPRSLAAFCSEELCAMFFAFAREVTGHDFAEFITVLAHESREGVDYACWLPGPVRFGERRTRIIGPASALALPQRSRDAETFEFLLSHFEGDDLLLAQFERRPLSLKLYDHLVRNAGTPPSLARAAAALNTSERTLARHLAAERSSFGEVLDAFRRKYALELLGETLASPKQIAHALGYRSENSLRRAFKGWTGEPVARWRRERPR